MKEDGWAPVHDTQEVWGKMWRQFRSYEAPCDPDYHLRRGTYGRGVLWASLLDNATHAAALHNAAMRQLAERLDPPKDWWRK